ncbi:MAG TPA: PSD1 and planctomycete cytochrome C domain-containing protein [Tepidisphaeraceae bacterium]|nr:PSD1 and planctomycete cytochrome C domain-containing protein [Tepidisphaeraceae bacterium]
MRTFLAILGVVFGTFASVARADEGPVDFAKDIQPILAQHCTACHGEEKTKGHLRLDVRSLALEGGTSGASIIPGQGDQSYLVQRLRGEGGEEQMPLDRDPLPAEQIALIARWIDQGAHWPEELAGRDVARKQHWAFVKPERPVVPVVSDKSWPRNPIDNFILARLEKEGLKPSPEASRETLLRRAALDLTGLPPTPAELDAFAAGPSTDAYAKQVERLLASPHYGERQARHWLDNARYADSNGYSHDYPRTIWPYRDWVINALNADMPFDQFTIEQLAGDLLPDATRDQRIATGFHRNTQINTEGGIDPEQFRVEAVVDRVGTTATVFLGQTLACAQCHNHKFDPFSQKEYYEFFAFFNNTDEPNLKVTGITDPREIEAGKARIAQLEEAVQEKIANWEATLTDAQRAQLKPDAREALAIPADQRNSKQQEAVKAALRSVDNDFGAMADALVATSRQLTDGVSTLILAERTEDPRKTTVFIKGDFTRPGEPVSPGVPRVLPPLKAKTEKPTRLDLAKWIVDPENPLTARVTVNRIWQQYFGRGIVETENDFGTQGIPPTHPELLDYLATELIESKWSLKHIHRLITTSATYRQSSVVRPDLDHADPYNKLYARQSRLRLDAEIVRDVALASSGLLTPKIGGPSVFPPIPDGVMGLGQVNHPWRTSTGPDRYRRGMYTFAFRNSLHPSLATFDAPDGIAACTRRIRSNTPLQALNLLNDVAWMEFSRGLARRALSEQSADDATRLVSAFRAATSRNPAADELAILTTLLARARADFANDPSPVSDLVADQTPGGTSEAEFAAWTLAARTILNLDETITRE